MENNKTPKIRFKGFTDPWEQRKVYEIADRFDNLRVPVAANLRVAGETPYYGANGIQDYVDGYTHDGEYVLVAEDGASDLKNYPVNYVNGCIWVNNHAHVLQGKNNIASNRFLSYAISLANIESVLVGGGRAKLNADVMMNLNIDLPTYKEQCRVAEYFSNLDNLITLHQRKYNKLLNVKKSMLEKMFPKNGSNIPEIRFKGFTDPWEQRKLGDIADIVGGGTPSTNNADYWDGDIDWYAPAEIGDKIFVDSSERKITKEGFENCSAKLLPAGSVLFTSRAGIGKMAILRKESCTNQGFQSIVPHEGELDSYFIFSRSDELKNYGETVGAGSTFVEVSGKQMSNMNLMMPKSYSEQIVIGKYFSQLDDFITLHQRELEKLQNIKKSMLEKMFV